MGYIFAIHNKYMPGLYRISASNTKPRNLVINDTLWLPAPFTIEYLKKVDDPWALQLQCSRLFRMNYISHGFYKLSLAQIDSLFQLLPGTHDWISNDSLDHAEDQQAFNDDNDDDDDDEDDDTDEDDEDDDTDEDDPNDDDTDLESEKSFMQAVANTELLINTQPDSTVTLSRRDDKGDITNCLAHGLLVTHAIGSHIWYAWYNQCVNSLVALPDYGSPCDYVKGGRNTVFDLCPVQDFAASHYKHLNLAPPLNAWTDCKVTKDLIPIRDAVREYFGIQD